jgi:hydroxydechloroatrazine ethylaminohydrolase
MILNNLSDPQPVTPTLKPTLILTNIAALVTCDGKGRVHRDCDLVCEDGVISAIFPTAMRYEKPSHAEVIDASGLFIYPGLINTHHHFFQAFVRNQLGLDWSQLSLVEWLRRIYPIFSLINEDCIFHTTMISMAELIKHGCTTAFDHQYCYNRHAGKHLIDRQFEAAAICGMRFVAGRGTNTLRAVSGSTMPDAMVESTKEYLSDCERLIQHYHDPSPFSMRNVVLAPCQPINCQVETFTASLNLARQHGLLVHTHLGEGENALMLQRHGLRSLDWCETIGFTGPDIWIAHGWELSRAEMFRLAELEIGLSHCPAPMCLVGDGITDLGAAWAAGVRVGLGVDGYASNDNSNLLDCIRLAYLLQCLAAPKRDDPLPPPREFLHYATRGGATLLQRPRLGSLEPGQAADFFAIDSTSIELVGASHDPELLLVKVAYGREVDLTVINGRVVWQRSSGFTGFNERAAAVAAEQVFRSTIYNSEPLRQLRNLA